MSDKWNRASSNSDHEPTYGPPITFAQAQEMPAAAIMATAEALP
jgi:hypothetical protein